MNPDGSYNVQNEQEVYQLTQANIPITSIKISDGNGGYRAASGKDAEIGYHKTTGNVGPDGSIPQTNNGYGGGLKALSDKLGLPLDAVQSLLTGGGAGSSGIVDAVNKVAGEAQGYATQNRDFQLTGLDKSNQAFQPAQQSYGSMYGPGGTQTTAGQGEQAFQNVGGQLLQPGAQSQAFGQTSGYLSGQSPGMTALGQVAGQLGGPTLSSQTYGQYANQLAQPSNAQGAYQNAATQLGQPSLAQQSYGTYANALGAPSAGEQRYQQTQGQYDANPLQQGYGALQAKYDAPTNLQSSLGDISAKYSAPSNAQSAYSSQQQQLSGPGALEQFAASDLKGSNPYYDQLRQTQDADINAQFNARGGYNSGAAMRAIALGDSNLAAQQYQQEGQLQGQAQQAQMSRLGQQQSGASSADSSNYAGAAGLTNTLGTADAQRLAATNGQVGLAGAASGMNLSYLQGGQSAANSAGSADLARTQAGINLAQGTDAGNLARIQTGGQLANAADSQNLAKTQAGINLSQGTDATNLAQNLGYVGAANAAGAGQTSQYTAYGDMAQGLDATQLAQLNAYLNQAGAAQGLTQGREQQGYADAFGMGAQQAGNTLTAYGNAGNQYASMIDASLSAQLNGAQLQAQQNANGQQNALGYAGLITKLLTA